ncbi:MAG TPA: hypothetical protein VMD28_01965, partial [Acidimicrobiales bacterium]|nr:hypothetical protein [Acidimicrobiales bacterium]
TTPKTTEGTTGETTTAPTAASPSSQTLGLMLPAGKCTGVTGFAGVTAPTSLPPLTSSQLDADLSTELMPLTATGGFPAFGGTAAVKLDSGSTKPVDVKVGTCLAEGGSILAVDVTGSTGNEVQLVGSLVAQPYSAATGRETYLFRGNLTRVPATEGLESALPWGLPSGFVAEVQVQQETESASLAVVFMQPDSGATGGRITGSGSTGALSGTPSAGSTPSGSATSSTTG